MAGDCELLDVCGFFRKYGEVRSGACQGFVNRFCRGPEQGACKRKEYRAQHGKPPSDDMLPSGGMLKG